MQESYGKGALSERTIEQPGRKFRSASNVRLLVHFVEVFVHCLNTYLQPFGNLQILVSPQAFDGHLSFSLG